MFGPLNKVGNCGAKHYRYALQRSDPEEERRWLKEAAEAGHGGHLRKCHLPHYHPSFQRGVAKISTERAAQFHAGSRQPPAMTFSEISVRPEQCRP